MEETRDFLLNISNNSIIQTINFLFIDYLNLDEEIKNQMADCKIDTSPAKLRCENKYGKDSCQISENHPYKYVHRCNVLYQRNKRNLFEYHNECFEECPPQTNMIKN